MSEPTYDTSAERDDFSIGLLTEDELLVQRVGLAVGRARGRLVVASESAPAFDLLASQAHAVRLVDTSALARLLPDLAKMHGIIGAEGGLELWVGAPATAFANGRPFNVHAYPRAAVDAALAHLQTLMPDRERNRRAHELILGETPRIRLVREQMESLARFGDVFVLILGETGTGKELVAEALHKLTLGPDRPFVAINCAAVPDSLFESELFGHEAGAYTGARGVRVGLLEAAAGGSVFLDEVGEMPASLQPKLLRVLETRSFRRVGSNRDIKLSARVVSATNRLPSRAEEARVRSDLYYRLAGFTLTLPPLRERLDDLPLLAAAFLRAFARRYDIQTMRFEDGALDRLRAHDWPGNVRELRAAVEQAAILAPNGAVGTADIARVLQSLPPAARVEVEVPPPALPPHSSAPPEPTLPMLVGPPSSDPTNVRELERRLVTKTFAESGNNLSRAAKALGLPRSTLRAKLRRWGVL